MSDVNPDQTVEQFLAEENRRLRQAGCKLAEAALYVAREYDGVHRLLLEATLYVAREYDGVHRLLLAVAEWTTVVANEGGRGALKKSEEEGTEPLDFGDTDLYHIYTIRSRNLIDLFHHRTTMREKGWHVGPIEPGDPGVNHLVGKFVFIAKIRKELLSEEEFQELVEWDRQQGE